MRWVIKCSLRHYEWWDALKLTGYYLPVIRFCHGLNSFKVAYLGNHTIWSIVSAEWVRLPPRSLHPSTLPSLSVLQHLFILRLKMKTEGSSEDGGFRRMSHSTDCSLQPVQTGTSTYPLYMYRQTEKKHAMWCILSLMKNKTGSYTKTWHHVRKTTYIGYYVLTRCWLCLRLCSWHDTLYPALALWKVLNLLRKTHTFTGGCSEQMLRDAAGFFFLIFSVPLGLSVQLWVHSTPDCPKKTWQ